MTVLLIALHPRYVAPLPVAIAGMAAVLVPWGLEAADLTSRTLEFSGESIVMRIGSGSLDPTLAQVGLVSYVVVVIAIAAWLANFLARSRRTMERKLQLQAWHLRQLVPR